MRLHVALALSALLTGCGTARTVVLDAPEAEVGFSQVTIVAHDPTVGVPQSVTDVFESELRQDLCTLGPFSPGTGLELRYSFVSHEEGNRFARWFWGGIGNSGAAAVTVVVVNPDSPGREVARTQVEGRIGSGFVGGSMEYAIRQAASDVAVYTIDKFASPAQLASGGIGSQAWSGDRPSSPSMYEAGSSDSQREWPAASSGRCPRDRAGRPVGRVRTPRDIAPR